MKNILDGILQHYYLKFVFKLILAASFEMYSKSHGKWQYKFNTSQTNKWYMFTGFPKNIQDFLKA